MQSQFESTPLEIWIRERLAAGGPVTFAQFMSWALYHPEHGYYTKGPNIGPRGDFTTSPEASPAFGRLLARHVEDVDTLLGSPSQFAVVEAGPGRGTLAAGLLGALKARNSSLYGRLRYMLVEVSPSLVLEQQAALLPEHDGVVEWRDSLSDLEPNLQGAVIANEVIDAFPVHVLEMRDGRVLEQFVSLDAEGRLATCLMEPSDPRLVEFLREAQVELEEGERVEVNLDAEAWVCALSGALGKGVVTIIDYGDTAPARYNAARRDGTLLAYRGGEVTDNLLAHPGEQDITALVDFSALARWAELCGFAVAGQTRQANFLVGLGLGTEERLDGGGPSLDEALAYRRGLQALISMEGLGRFHVLLLSKGLAADMVAPALAGLRYAQV